MASNYSVFDTDGQALRNGLAPHGPEFSPRWWASRRGDHRPDMDWRKRIFENFGNALICSKKPKSGFLVRMLGDFIK